METGKEVISWIHSLLTFGIKPGLKRMEWMLARLDHPEQQLKAIHVGGTNGKGSTVNFMRSVLEVCGYSVGTFTSPYIERFEERISINGKPIPEEDLVACANVIRPLVEELSETDLGSPTEFEVITAIAFYYFAQIAKPDLAIIEVGLGGRFDSTNVINPLLSIITSIGYDHMHILGNTLTEIASEKAGIIKKNTPIISGVVQEKAREVIAKAAKENQAEYAQLRIDFTEELMENDENEQMFLYKQKNEAQVNYTIQMKGPHQRENAAVAIYALRMLQKLGDYTVSEEAISRGLYAMHWPGRFEKINENPLIIIDGAHNEQGMASLAATLKAHYPKRRFRFLIAATEEKEMQTLLAPFTKMDATFMFTSFPFFRAAKAVQLYKDAPINQKQYDEDWERAFVQIRTDLQEDEAMIVCGSLYFISEVRAKWNKVSVIDA